MTAANHALQSPARTGTVLAAALGVLLAVGVTALPVTGLVMALVGWVGGSISFAGALPVGALAGLLPLAVAAGLADGD